MAATDDMWGKLETAWCKILNDHTPGATYIHMREICHQTKGFDRKFGWNDDNAFGLSNKCLVYLSQLDKKRFSMFYCAIDLKAYRQLREETYQLPEPVDLCNRFCSETILGWYLNHYPDVIDPENDTIKYFFDTGEYFKVPFENKWNGEKALAEKTGSWSIWKRIKEVACVDMKDVPGVQAADLIAWAVNREKTGKHGAKGEYMAHIMRQVIPAWSIVWDEERLRKQFKPLLYLP